MVNLESKRLEDILKLANGLVLLILLNLIVSDHFFRLDLTEENRFSISEATRELLRNLDDNVYVDVYLEGDLPSGFERLKQSVRETLEQFRVYSDNKVQYTFINPDQAASRESRDEFMMSIAEKGIRPTDVFLTENGNRIQKRILPGAVVTYGSREKGVLLLKGNKGASPEEQLNQSAEGVEYELASAINALTKERPEVIGFTTGHGELSGNRIVGLKETLREQYLLQDINLAERTALIGVDLLLIAKPENSFSVPERYRLDQYIMAGGNVIFLLDAVKAETDTVSIAFPYDLGLDNQLFKYGVRINKDLVQDMFSLREPVVVGNMGDNPQIETLQWPFYPLINTFGDHPIVRNMDAIGTYYISSIDTVKADGITKTPLLFTSPYARTLQAPVKIDLNELKKPVNSEDFNQSNIPVGYLLEGNFTSAFKNRPLPSGINGENFREEGSSAIIVFADGDIAGNKINPETGNPLPLGVDYYNQQNFANEDIILNAIQYLLDEQGFIQARNKEIALRPLDKVKVEEERSKWQLINLILPVLVLVVYGTVNHYLRKRKYALF